MIFTWGMTAFHESILDAPDLARYTYKCVVCVQRDENFDNPAAALSYIYFCNGTGNYKQMRIDRFEVYRARVVESLKRPGDDGEEQGEAGQDPKRGRKVYKLALAEQQFEGGHFRYFLCALAGWLPAFRATSTCA